MLTQRLFTRLISLTGMGRGLLAVVAVIVVLCTQAVAQAAPLEVVFEVSPSVIQLTSGETKDVLITVRNATSGWLQELRLTCFTDVGVTISYESSRGTEVCAKGRGIVLRPDQAQTASILPNGSATWLLHVVRMIDGSATGKVYFQLQYAWRSNDVAESVSGVAPGTLEIRDLLPESVDKVASVQVETAIDQLQEHRSGTLYLVVRNLSGMPITVTQITTKLPLFAVLDPPAYGEIAVEAQTSQPFAFTAMVTDAVRPGRHLLLFEVRLAWVESGHVWTGSLIATHGFEAGVLAESDILKLVGVPSFLLLPGFLMVVTFIALWTYITPGKAPQLKAISPESLLLSISLSLLTAALYPTITGWFGLARDYLESYGLRDVVIVWTGSIGSAIVTWMFVTISIHTVKRIETRRNIPSPHDTPIEVLRKMARQQIAYPPQLAQIESARVPECFIVLPDQGESKKVWVSPAIVYDIDPKALVRPDGEPSPSEQFIKSIEAAHQGKNPAAMARALEQSMKDGICSVEWNKIGGFEQPQQFDADKVKTKQAALVDFVRSAEA